LRKIALALTDEDQLNLERIISRGEDWRERQRAETLILLSKNNSTSETAAAIGIHARTVRITLKDWLARGYISLVDAPRSGAPRKINSEELVTIVGMASAEPLTAKTLLAKHLENGGANVHVNTLRTALKGAGFLWKRTRHSLKKKE
jgi:transposase